MGQDFSVGVTEKSCPHNMNNRSTKRIDLLPQIVQTSCRSDADAVQILCRFVYTPKTIDYQVLCMEKCRVQTFLDFVNVSPKSMDVTHDL